MIVLRSISSADKVVKEASHLCIRQKTTSLKSVTLTFYRFGTAKELRVERDGNIIECDLREEQDQSEQEFSLSLKSGLFSLHSSFVIFHDEKRMLEVCVAKPWFPWCSSLYSYQDSLHLLVKICNSSTIKTSRLDIRNIWELIVRERLGINSKDFYYDCVHNLKRCIESKTDQEYYLKESVDYAYSEVLEKRTGYPLENSGLYSLIQDVQHFELAKPVFKYITGFELTLDLVEIITERKRRKIQWQDLLNEISLCYCENSSELDPLFQHLNFIASQKQDEGHGLIDVDYLNTELLIKYFKESWKLSQKQFCNIYNIDLGNFSAWLGGKHESLASEISVKLFLKDSKTTPVVYKPKDVKKFVKSSLEELPEHIAELNDTDLITLWKLSWNSTQNEFCKLFNIDPCNFSAWLSGKRKSLASKWAIQLYLKDFVKL